MNIMVRVREGKKWFFVKDNFATKRDALEWIKDNLPPTQAWTILELTNGPPYFRHIKDSPQVAKGGNV